MKFTITENRLVDFIDKYLENVVGNLRILPIDHINAREGDFQVMSDNGIIIFYYMDYQLGVDKKLFSTMLSLFNLKKEELEKLLEKWFKTRFPDNLVISVYPLLEL
jgi:hypothetical protein